MQSEITKYINVQSATIKGLQATVTEYLNNGWQPLGGMQIGKIAFYQTMVKYYNNSLDNI